MNGFLLDTCAISEAVCRNPDRGFTAWLRDADAARIYLSVISLGEIRKGIDLLADRHKKAALEVWLTSDLMARFAGRILTFDSSVADRWWRLIAGSAKRGRTVPAIDSLLAATAIHHNLSVVTRNERDFAFTDVSLTNPWSGRYSSCQTQS